MVDNLRQRVRLIAVTGPVIAPNSRVNGPPKKCVSVPSEFSLIADVPSGETVSRPPRAPKSNQGVVGEPGATATVLMITVPAMLEIFLDRFHAAATWPEREAVAAEFGITFLLG